MSQKQEPSSELPVIVVGGGLAGLSAAVHLAERGVYPLLLEADPACCGGRVAGGDMIDVNGWQFRGEHGMHGIWSGYRNLQGMLTRLNIRPMFIPSSDETWIFKRKNRVRRAEVGEAIRQSWLPAPFHYLSLLTKPSFLWMAMSTPRDWLSLFLVWYGLVLPLGVDPLREWQPMAGAWLSDLVKWWPPALRAFFIGLARNGMPARPEEVPLAGFIAFLRYYTLLRRDAWAFSYMPEDAGSCLIDPLAQKLEQLGGTIQLGARVTKLEQLEAGWRVTWQQAGQLHHRTAAQLILATDAPNTAVILQNSPDTAAAAADLFWPRGLETAMIRTWFRQPPRPGTESGMFSGEFMIHNYFWLHRILEPYRRWHQETGGSAIEVHIYGPAETLAKPDGILMTRALLDIQHAFPEIYNTQIHQTIHRHPATHTLPAIGPAETHLGTETPWPRLFCCGDWVRHTHPSFFLERACVTGIAAANGVLGEQEPAWPIVDPPPPEPFAAWIEQRMRQARARARKRSRRRQQR